mmetsp:Transcript_146460/g.255427  ORF Transcript_146460/g.255427 Transcript_146460/m.255427 type:complete len:273 (-) Transcript_146460:184-1002(-)
MASALRMGRDPSPAGLRRAPSPGLRRAPSPAELRRRATSPAEARPSLRSAGRSLLGTPSYPPQRPTSRQDEDDDDDTMWCQKQRSAIKKQSRHSAPPQQCPFAYSKPFIGDFNNSKCGEDAKAKVPRHVLSLSGLGCLPPLKVPVHQVPSYAPPAPEGRADKQPNFQDSARRNSKGLPEDKDTTEVGREALRRARAEAKAQSSACWEDLISFLEMNKLSGAYALAFSAYGVEDLSTLLSLDDEALGRLLDKCNIDAMDEILLLEALRAARVR